MYQLFLKTVLAILIGACLGQAIIAIELVSNDNPHQKSAAKVAASTSQTVPPQQNLSVPSRLSPSEGEPLLLLFFGLAVFVGATTIQRKRSSVHSDGGI